jgi:hypothetical protein
VQIMPRTSWAILIAAGCEVACPRQRQPHCWMLDKTTNVTKGDTMRTSGTVRPEAK